MSHDEQAAPLSPKTSDTGAPRDPSCCDDFVPMELPSDGRHPNLQRRESGSRGP